MDFFFCLLQLVVGSFSPFSDDIGCRGSLKLFPVGVNWLCRIEDEIGCCNDRSGRIGKLLAPLLDDGFIETFGIGGCLLGCLGFYLFALDADAGAVESWASGNLPCCRSDLDAGLLPGEVAPAGTLVDG